MATPVKNFTDPTFLPMVMRGDVGIGAPTPAVPIAFAALTLGLKRELILVSLGRPPVTYNTVFSPIPPPPMGRQILMTFPPIYKERGTGEVVSTGQLFPPKAP